MWENGVNKKTADLMETSLTEIINNELFVISTQLLKYRQYFLQNTAGLLVWRVTEVFRSYSWTIQMHYNSSELRAPFVIFQHQRVEKVHLLYSWQAWQHKPLNSWLSQLKVWWTHACKLTNQTFYDEWISTDTTNGNQRCASSDNSSVLSTRLVGLYSAFWTWVGVCCRSQWW